MDMTMDCPTPTDSMVTVPLSDENQADGETRSSSSTTTTSDAASVGGSSSSNSQLLTDEQPVDRESSWAELDRTEEQEPRSEDSDEVRHTHTHTYWTYIFMPSTPMGRERLHQSKPKHASSVLDRLTPF